MFHKAVLPAAVLAKAHMPDLTTVVPAFDVESIEATPDEQIRRMSRLRVEFESIDFNRRFIATVPKGHDPIALRELFSPGAFSPGRPASTARSASEPPSVSSTSSGSSASGPAPSSSSPSTTRATSSAASAPSSRRPERLPTRRAPGTRGWSRSRRRRPGEARAEHPLGVREPGIARQQDLEVVAVASHLRRDRLDAATLTLGENRVGVGEGGELLEVATVGNESSRRSAACSSSAPAGVSQRASFDLRPVGLGTAVGGGEGDVEAGVEADRDDLRRDPARPRPQRGSLERDRCLLAELAGAADAVGELLGLDFEIERAGGDVIGASTAPPGKTQTLGMNRASLPRLSISTSRPRSRCLPLRRSRITVAAGRGTAGSSTRATLR